MNAASDLPATLNDAITTEPLWLQAWVLLLVVANLAAVLFLIGRKDGRWLVRPEAIAIVASFVAAALFMEWLYEQVGYVRLLGLAHLLCWGPSGPGSCRAVAPSARARSSGSTSMTTSAASRSRRRLDRSQVSASLETIRPTHVARAALPSYWSMWRAALRNARWTTSRAASGWALQCACALSSAGTSPSSRPPSSSQLRADFAARAISSAVPEQSRTERASGCSGATTWSSTLPWRRDQCGCHDDVPWLPGCPKCHRVPPDPLGHAGNSGSRAHVMDPVDACSKHNLMARGLVGLPCGDPTRMGRVLLGLEPRLTTVARRLVRDPDAAADIVQNAFEKVLRHCEEFRGDARPSTWMHRIVLNEAFMWLRRESRRSPARIDPGDWELMFVHAAGPEEAASAHGDRERVVRARPPYRRRSAAC